MARKTLGISPTTLATASLYPSYASNEPITPSPSYTSSPTLPYSHLGHATGLTPSTTRPESSIKVSTTRASMPPPPSDATVGVRRKSMSSVLDSLHYTKRVKRSVSPEPMCHPPALQKEIQVPIDEILQEERRLCGQAAKPPAPCVRWTTDASGKKKKARHLTTPFQTRVLRQVLAYTAFPSTEQRAHLAMEMGMTPRGVQIWFQNQRQKAKARQLAQMHMSKAAHRAMHRPLRSASAGPTHFPYREDDSDLLSIPEWGQPPYSLHESDEMSPTSSNSPDSFSLPHSPLNTPSEYDDEEGIDASMPLHHPPETSGRPDAPTLPPTPMYAEHSYSPTQYHTTSVKHGHLATPHYAYTIRQSHKEVKVLPRQPLANVLTGSSGVMGLGVEASDRSGGEGLNSSEWPQQWP
ncbi:hypothetical protein HK097_008166 [Rhizophlyctis rosea]|uniref:Homeobox domain-containing protein n=1 Tax=Rhizophlyctis rosea TaxID=64517 RepID=A0AAD5SC54_9FUNG|nr:hypothetical protein HK097_008166 [Rhizophlyctis rosea]